MLESSGLVPSGDGRRHVSTLGISSGGGVALHVCQSFSGKQSPRRQVLVCPWVNYDWENLFPSMDGNSCHDLVVTQAVNDYVKGLTERMAGGAEHRTTISPLGKSMAFSTETLVISSENEVTFDEGAELVRKIRGEGGSVEFFTQKYLAHVYCLISFLPEAIIAQNKMADFLKKEVE